MWKNFKRYSIHIFGFGHKRPCILCNFVPRGVFLQSSGAFLNIDLIEWDSTWEISSEGMVKKDVKMIPTQHLSNTIKWTHNLSFPLMPMVLRYCGSRLSDAAAKCLSGLYWCYIWIINKYAHYKMITARYVLFLQLWSPPYSFSWKNLTKLLELNEGWMWNNSPRPACLPHPKHAHWISVIYRINTFIIIC